MQKVRIYKINKNTIPWDFSKIVKVASVPLPSSDSISMLPPIDSTSRFDIVRPSPVPRMLNLLFFLTIPNIVNRFFASSFAIPTPVSPTVNSSTRTRLPSASSPVFSLTLRSMPPWSVNLNAFEIRFINTCLMRPMSDVKRFASTSRSQNTSNRIPLRSHCISKMYLISVTRLATANCASDRLNMPASILAMSRMSSVSDSSSFDEIEQIFKNFLFESVVCMHSASLLLFIGCATTSSSIESLLISSSDNAFENALMGVLNSCEILENITRRHSFVALAFSSFLKWVVLMKTCMKASSEFSQLTLRVLTIKYRESSDSFIHSSTLIILNWFTTSLSTKWLILYHSLFKIVVSDLQLSFTLISICSFKVLICKLIKSSEIGSSSGSGYVSSSDFATSFANLIIDWLFVRSSSWIMTTSGKHFNTFLIILTNSFFSWIHFSRSSIFFVMIIETIR